MVKHKFDFVSLFDYGLNSDGCSTNDDDEKHYMITIDLLNHYSRYNKEELDQLFSEIGIGTLLTVQILKH